MGMAESLESVLVEDDHCAEAYYEVADLYGVDVVVVVVVVVGERVLVVGEVLAEGTSADAVRLDGHYDENNEDVSYEQAERLEKIECVEHIEIERDEIERDEIERDEIERDESERDESEKEKGEDRRLCSLWPRCGRQEHRTGMLTQTWDLQKK